MAWEGVSTLFTGSVHNSNLLDIEQRLEGTQLSVELRAGRDIHQGCPLGTITNGMLKKNSFSPFLRKWLSVRERLVGCKNIFLLHICALTRLWRRPQLAV